MSPKKEFRTTKFTGFFDGICFVEVIYQLFLVMKVVKPFFEEEAEMGYMFLNDIISVSFMAWARL